MSYLELVEGIFWPVLGLGVYFFFQRRKQVSSPTRMSRAEMAALAVLLAYPFLGFAVAIGGAGMISPRCVAPVCCGIGLAAGVLAQRVFGAAPRSRIAIVLLMLVWVTVREAICSGILYSQRREFQTLVLDVAELRGNILVGDSSLVLPLYFYSDEDTRKQILFPIDFDAIHAYERDDSGEQNLWAGRNGVFPFRISELREIQLGPFSHGSIAPIENTGDGMAHHWVWCRHPLTVIGRPDGWLATSLRAQGFGLTPARLYPNWGWMGGVFTPMAHPDTQTLVASKPCTVGL
jgi:hypothetical protein